MVPKASAVEARGRMSPAATRQSAKSFHSGYALVAVSGTGAHDEAHAQEAWT
jgi:hypothetical protein